MIHGTKNIGQFLRARRAFQLISTIFTDFRGVKPSGGRSKMLTNGPTCSNTFSKRSENFRIIVLVFAFYNDELLQVCIQVS